MTVLPLNIANSINDGHALQSNGQLKDPLVNASKRDQDVLASCAAMTIAAMAHTPELCTGCQRLLDAVCLMQVCTEHTCYCGVPPAYQCVSTMLENISLLYVCCKRSACKVAFMWVPALIGSSNVFPRMHCLAEPGQTLYGLCITPAKLL